MPDEESSAPGASAGGFVIIRRHGGQCFWCGMLVEERVGNG